MELLELSELVVDLQSRLLFQEDAIQKLDEIIVRQATTIDRLLERVNALESQVDGLKYEKEQERAGTERPPHY